MMMIDAEEVRSMDLIDEAAKRITFEYSLVRTTKKVVSNNHVLDRKKHFLFLSPTDFPDFGAYIM